MADLFQEIMDDVQADRAALLWKKYGRFVIYAAVSVVVITAVMVFINHQKRETAMRDTAQFFTANELLEKGEASAALALFEKMSLSERSAYHGLVTLKKAQALSKMGKAEEASKMYAELARHNDVYGDIGKIYTGQKTDDSKTPLRFSRMEWAAWDTLSKGDSAKAAEQFALLAANEAAPASQRDRAGMIATYLKAKAAAHE